MVVAVYITFAIATFFSFVFDKSAKKYSSKVTSLMLPILIIVLALIAAFRSPLMPDYVNYLAIYKNDFSLLSRIELGFQILIYIVKHLFDSWGLFLFISALIGIILKIYAIKFMSPFVWTSIALYISSNFILQDMIQMRAAIASGLFLCSIYFLLKKDIKLFAITTCIAVFFHWSALLIIPIWFINTKSINRYLYLGLILISFIIAGLHINLLGFIKHIPIAGIQTLNSNYEYLMSIGKYNQFNLFNMLTVAKLALAIFFILFSDKIVHFNPYFIISLKLYCISIIIHSLFFSIPVAAGRLSEFFQISEILLVPMLIYIFPRSIWFGKIIVCMIGLLYLHYYTSTFPILL